MPPLYRLQVIVYISEPPMRERFREHWRNLEKATPRVLTSFDGMIDADSPETAIDHLTHYLDADKNHGVVLVSDGLIERSDDSLGEGEYNLTHWAREACDPFADRLLGTIAILTRPRRVPEIDRVIPLEFDAGTLEQALQGVVARLNYLATPVRHELLRPVVVREIKTRYEMRDYFRLRHQVYSVMGYLEEEVENTPSGMELDWWDTSAIHLGAFERDGPRQKLVGSARVVIADLRSARAETRTRELALGDEVLNSLLERVPPHQLPIFDLFATYPPPIVDIPFTHDRCGELSRVIVASPYRGAGLADILVKLAVWKALKNGVQRLFLECLNKHERMYAKYGFRPIEGVTGRVLGVDRTMISMELRPEEEEPSRAPTRVGTLPLVVEQDCLCACKHHRCYSGVWELYRQPACPLRDWR